MILKNDSITVIVPETVTSTSCNEQALHMCTLVRMRSILLRMRTIVCMCNTFGLMCGICTFTERLAITLKTLLKIWNVHSTVMIMEYSGNASK